MRYDAAELGIDGAYQHRALKEGNPIQRFWHFNKQLTIDRYLPPNPGDRVLDVGCGSGVISDFLAAHGANVTGVDGDERAIGYARETFHRENLAFQVGLVDQDFPAHDQIDKIYSLELIEHITFDQGRALLKAFHSCLKPGGLLYITTPNYKSLWPVIEWLLDNLKLAPQMGGHQHIARYSRRLMREACEAEGFVVETVTTTSFLAPWLAPLSWKLALRANAMETGSRFGSIIVCVARKK